MRIFAMHGIAVTRRNVAGVRKFTDPRTGRAYHVKLGKKGEADLTGTIPPRGTRLECEVKTPGERPTPEQWEFLRGQERLGAVAFWCDDAGWLMRACPHLIRGARTRIAADGQIDLYYPEA